MILPNKNLREIERFGPDEGKLHVFQEADEKNKVRGLTSAAQGHVRPAVTPRFMAKKRAKSVS